MSSRTARSDLLFGLYAQLGASRSLTRLHRYLVDLGVPISIATLKRYSSRGGWLQRATDLDAEAARRQDERGVNAVLSMLDRHAGMARALQGAATTALQDLLTNRARLSTMAPADIARLLDLGLREERRALGESTERHDIAVSLANLVTSQLVKLFVDLNSESDQAIRAELFASGIDTVISAFLATKE
jgi:hypothetical protein